MKRLAMVLVFLGCLNASAWQRHFFVDASSSNIPATFTTGSSSRVMTDLVGPIVLTMCNETAARLCVNHQTYDGSTPSAINFRIPAGQCLSTGVRYAPVVFISGCGSIVAAGFVHGFSD